jgi:hypothetical protein
MISDLLLLEFEEEVKKTRAMLERVPMKEDFKPHAKSMPLGKLAPHVAELAGFGLTILTTPELDFSNAPRTRPAFESPQQLAKVFDEGRRKGSPGAEEYPRRGVDSALEAKFSGKAHLQRVAVSGIPADVPESFSTSSGAARGLPAA